QRIDNTGMVRIKVVAVKAAQIIVGDEGRIGDQNSGPAPHPFVGQIELAGRYRDTAERLCGGGVGAVARRKVAGVLLINAGGLNRVTAGWESLLPIGLH